MKQSVMTISWLVYLCALISLLCPAHSDSVTECSGFPRENYIKQLYVVSEQSNVKLKCDTSNSGGGYFLWQSSTTGAKYSGIYTEDDSNNKYAKEGEGADSSLVLGKVTKEMTGFYCCKTYSANFITQSVSMVYAVLVLPDNFKPSLRASPEGAVDENAQVTLTCENPPEAKLSDSIVPTIEWKLPRSLTPPSPPTSEYTYNAKGVINDKEFQCALKYQLTAGPREFLSNPVSGSVKFGPTMLDARSTDNSEAVVVELGKARTIDCVFAGNPKIDPKDTSFYWTKVPLLSKEGEEEVLDQCATENSLSPVESIKADLDVELVPTSSSNGSTTTFSLTIKNFEKNDAGCYTCHFGQLERSFNVIDMYVP